MKNSFEKKYNISEYYYYKYIKAIACSKKPSEVIDYLFDNFNVDDMIISCILAVSKLFVASNINFMDSHMKDNMYCFASFLRTVCDDYDGINELIVLINKCDDSKIKDIVSYEFMKRFCDKKIIINALNNLDASVKLFKYMNVLDMNMLITHSEIYDFATFILISDVYASDSLEYMSSINMIINECPELLKDELFFSKIHFVCDRIYPRIVDKGAMKVYKKFKKNIK